MGNRLFDSNFAVVNGPMGLQQDYNALGRTARFLSGVSCISCLSSETLAGTCRGSGVPRSGQRSISCPESNMETLENDSCRVMVIIVINSGLIRLGIMKEWRRIHRGILKAFKLSPSLRLELHSPRSLFRRKLIQGGEGDGSTRESRAQACTTDTLY